MITGEIEMATAKETDTIEASSASMSRKDKRKVTKKEKRKQKRKEVAVMDRQIEEAQLNDPDEQRRIQLEMEMENERLERERREFEERERLFLEALARKTAEEEERRRALEEEEEKLKEHQAERNLESNESDEWEYVDEGPPEIIWQGNEIIIKKNKVKVKKSTHQEITIENPNRPTSNPLLPQSEVFSDYQNASVLSAQQILENVAHQTPNFGTEQDKAHCPFHLKTGACRFGSRCSRVHFYPDKSCTMLMKNMYNGPGLAWEQDEGLEYTDEEVERFYEEFYEDVHTEFLKFGEIINFKVCRNGSYHLRGNVYVHYKSLDSAWLAYQSINGRYFAGKQVTCEFVSVTRWKVAICGEYMKSKLKTCSRGTACNFIHCFRNPCGDYEWADWDKPPPRFWMENMAALFGYSDESQSVYGRQSEEETVGPHRNSNKRLGGGRERHHRLRSHSKEFENSNRRSREHYAEDNSPRSNNQQRHINGDKRRAWDFVHKTDKVKDQFRCHANDKKRDYRDEYDLSHRHNDDGGRRKRSRCSQDKKLESDNYQETCSTATPDNVSGTGHRNRGGKRRSSQEFTEKNSRQQETSSGSTDNFGSHKRRSASNDSNSGWRRTDASDSNSDLSGGITEISHLHKRSSRHLIEVSGTSYNHSDKYPQNDSDHVKSKFMMETSSHRKKLHNAKTSEVEISDEYLKSSDRLEHGKSREYHERSKSYDSDFSSHSSALEFEKKLHRESGSHDYREPLEETDTSDRWVPDKDYTGKRHKHRRKSDRSYQKKKSKDPGSHDWSSESSDAFFQESRSRGTIKSKEGRSRGTSKSKEGRSRGSHAPSEKNCKMSSTRSDSERKLKECGESDRSHERKSDLSDKKQESNNPGSHNWSSESSDGCFKESRSRSSRKSREGRSRARRSSSDRKCKTSSTHIDYGKEQKESCEGDRTRKRKKISLVQEE